MDQPMRRPVGVWPRFKAQVADAIVVAIATATLTLLVSGHGLEEPWRPLVWVAFGLVTLGYFTICEWRYGQTLGKRLVDIEVRSQDGGSTSLGQAFVRTVFRIVDGLALYIVGAVFVWTSPARQRLGDRVAGTLVMRSRPDAPVLRGDGTHARGQEEADSFVAEVQSEIGRPHHR
jgi:uncharacterized RDD family membrane protein YckC